MAHKAKAVILTCIDFRFQSIIQEFLEKEGLKDNFDKIALAGASLSFIEPLQPSDKETLERQMELSYTLHHPDVAYLIDHDDCGAYGQDNSEERHTRNLKQSKQILKERYPDLEVRTFIAGFESVREV